MSFSFPGFCCTHMAQQTHMKKVDKLYKGLDGERVACFLTLHVICPKKIKGDICNTHLYILFDYAMTGHMRLIIFPHVCHYIYISVASFCWEYISLYTLIRIILSSFSNLNCRQIEGLLFSHVCNSQRLFWWKHMYLPLTIT